MPTVTPEMFLRAVHRTGAVYVHNHALAALGLCTELGEFAANPSVDEAGDVLWHVALLCEQLDLLVWSGVVATAGYCRDDQYRDCPPSLHEILCDLDHVKKMMAGSTRVDKNIAAGALIKSVVFVHRHHSLEDAMRANIIKLAKRDPRALPAEVLELIEEGVVGALPAASGGVWRTREGSLLRVSDMTDEHLNNAVNMLIADPTCITDDIQWVSLWVAAFRSEQRRRRAAAQ